MSLIDTDVPARIAGGSPDAGNVAAVVAVFHAHGRTGLATRARGWPASLGSCAKKARAFVMTARFGG